MRNVGNIEPQIRDIKQFNEMKKMEKNVNTCVQNILRDSVPSNKNCTIMIVGYYGYDNLGDEAILEVMIRDIKEINPQVRIVVPSNKAKRVEEIHKVSSVHLMRWGMVKSFLKSDVIITGGGGLFASYSGFFVYFIPFFALLGKIFRKKVIYYSIGIYSTASSFLVRATKFSMKLSDVVSVRDSISFKTLKGLKDVLYVPDPALRLKSISKEEATEILKKEGINSDKFLIGLSLRPKISKKMDDELVREITKTIDLLLDTLDAIVIFHRFSLGSDCVVDDQEIAKEILKKIKHKDRFRILDYYPPSVTKGLIGMMNYFIGMRLHSMIFAHSMGVPFIGIIYEKKCESFLEMIEGKGVDISNLEKLSDMVRDDVKGMLNAE